MLNKLFPWEHEIETDSDCDDEQGSIDKKTSVRTENAAIHEALDKGKKRKQNEAVEGRLISVFRVGNQVKSRKLVDLYTTFAAHLSRILEVDGKICEMRLFLS